MAQIETALHFLGPEILDLQANKQVVSRDGNRSRFAAPQGCYRCAGEDNWCAIAIDTDEQWIALFEEMGKEVANGSWATDPAMATHSARIAVHDQIDTELTRWTQNLAAETVMQRLQAAGVPAGVVQRSKELLADKQYTHRDFYRFFDHPEMGRIPYAGHQYRISDYDNGPRGPAPLIGQHSFEVLSEILNFSDEDIAQAFANGAIA